LESTFTQSKTNTSYPPDLYLSSSVNNTITDGGSPASNQHFIFGKQSAFGRKRRPVFPVMKATFFYENQRYHVGFSEDYSTIQLPL